MGTVHNAIRRATNLLKAFHNALALDGDDSGVERFGETLTPVIDLWSRPDWAFLRGERLGFGGGVLGAPAGQNATMVLSNPAGSGVLVIVTHVLVRSSAAERIIVELAAAGAAPNFGTDLDTGNRDSRVTPSATGRLRAVLESTSQVGALGSGIGEMWGSTDPTVIPWDHVLAPGSALIFRQNTVAQELRFAAWWRERPVFTSEV